MHRYPVAWTSLGISEMAHPNDDELYETYYDERKHLNYYYLIQIKSTQKFIKKTGWSLLRSAKHKLYFAHLMVYPEVVLFGFEAVDYMFCLPYNNSREHMCAYREWVSINKWQAGGAVSKVKPVENTTKSTLIYREKDEQRVNYNILREVFV